jgi:polyphosphate kinase
MSEDGTYKIKELNGEPPFNIHKEFYKVKKEIFQDVKLF